MKIMLDSSLREIDRQSQRLDFEFWQLRTPLTRHHVGNVPYGLDNGCFSRFARKTWFRMLTEAEQNRPVFVCLPDIVGDAQRTIELFEVFKRATNGLPRALVLQDGIGNCPIPWEDIDAVFVGGSDTFKISPECINACRAAKILDKWIHVGRVNGVQRLSQWIGFADSIDGSGISRFDHMLEPIVSMIKADLPEQQQLKLAH